MSSKRNAELEKYLLKAGVTERSDALLKLMGWFSVDPDSEFWIALEQLTLAKRAAEDVDDLLSMTTTTRGSHS